MDKRTQQVIFSSNSDEWDTPQDFYDRLNLIYNFTLDPATNGFNSKCQKYFTDQEDGLQQSWQDEVVFVNPPYSKIKLWVKKCFEEGQKPNTTVVMLIPSRTDTKYWHNYIMKAESIGFIKGRLKFGNAKTGAPFPSAVVVFSRNNKNSPVIYTMEK